jgi:hypothetical protein
MIAPLFFLGIAVAVGVADGLVIEALDVGTTSHKLACHHINEPALLTGTGTRNGWGSIYKATSISYEVYH